MTDTPKIGGPSPWGRIQSVSPLGTSAAVIVTTASHGGAWVPQAELHRIPDRWREYGARWAHGYGEQWYEEDSAIAAPLCYLPGAGTPKQAAQALEELERIAACEGATR